MIEHISESLRRAEPGEQLSNTQGLHTYLGGDVSPPIRILFVLSRL